MKSVALILLFAWACSFHAQAAPGDDVATLLKKGDALDKALKTSEALDTYLEAQKLDPNNMEVLQRLSKEYGLSMTDVTDEASRRERGMKALDCAKRAAAMDGNNATNELALAICYGRVAPYLDNKTKIAYSKLVKEHIDHSLKLDSTNDLAYFVLGSWNYELANLNSILRVIASAIYGTLPSASNEAAADCFKKALTLNPSRLSSYVELGRTYAAMKQKSLAQTNLKKGLEMTSHEKDDEFEKARARDALQRL